MERSALADCTGDIDGDGQIAAGDLALILGGWGPVTISTGVADVDRNGVIDGVDLGIVLSAWGSCATVPSWAIALEATPNPAVVTNPALRQAIIETGYAWRVRDIGTNIEMLLVPPGTFEMGCSASSQHPCEADESPVRPVTITSPFYLGRTEVSQGQWWAEMGWNPSYFYSPQFGIDTSRPVESVSWQNAQLFMSFTGMRLPTEAEWEYAARAGTATAFHAMPGQPEGTGNDALVGSVAWFASNSGNITHPVGSKPANSLGFRDMLGNVAEWVVDRYDPSAYAWGQGVDPVVLSSGTGRVMRGGAWNSTTAALRVSDRDAFIAETHGLTSTGFRVARDAGPRPSVTSVVPNYGRLEGGATVAISGSRLAETTSIRIGGIAASNIVVVSDTLVTATVPAGTVGAKDIVLTTDEGGTGVSRGFTYLRYPAWGTVLAGLPDPAVVTSATFRQAIVGTGRPWRVRHDASGIELMLIPPGQFTMGCSGTASGICDFGDEVPRHQVSFADGYYIGRYEVTQSQWSGVTGSNPAYHQGSNFPGAANRPVEQVTWDQISDFLVTTDLRLPTEAEWEYACRAGTDTAYHGIPSAPLGSDLEAYPDAIGWFGGNIGQQGSPDYAPRPVGLKPPNGFGVHDMAGNVCEWVADWYDANYYVVSPELSPQGPRKGLQRVFRGGCYLSGSNQVRSSGRAFEWPIAEAAGRELGFRVARRLE